MKPENILYGLEDRPPNFIVWLMGLQHVSILSISFVFPLLLVHEMGGGTDQITFLISMSMLAGGIGVIVQGLNKGPVGSGYLCPQLCGPSFLTASIMCAKTGGLPLVFGMTAFAGLFEALFSRIIHRLRVLFPTEVTGLIVAMVGITVVKLAGKNLLSFDEAVGAVDTTGLMVGLTTLLTMTGLNIWSKGKIRLFCILLGMMTGYALALMVGELSFQEINHAMSRPMFWFPFTHHPGWAFDLHMVLPMTIAVLCSSLKSVGDLTTCQKINDTRWKRPDMKNIQKGILADAVGCFSAGIFGGLGQSTSSSNIGLSIATATTSRIISMSTGIILIFLAFCPKLAGIFAIMPKPVVGATLIFSITFMIVAGLQIVMSRMLDGRKTFVIGLSIIFGLTVDMMPEAYDDLHPMLAAVFSSSLSAATVSAIILNLIFRIGIKSKAYLEIEPDEKSDTAIIKFMQHQGGAWAARPEVIKKATAAASEYLEALKTPGAIQKKVTLEASFDEHNLDITISHTGEPPVFSELPPTPTALIEAGGQQQLAGFIVQSWTDKLTSKYANGQTTSKLHFIH